MSMARAKRRLIFGAKVCFLVLMAVYLAACQGSAPLANLRGDITARIDLAQGEMRILQYGLGSPADDEHKRLFKTRYGIEIKTVAGCVVSQDQAAYWDAYNAVMREAISRKYGSDVIDRTIAEAEQRYAAASSATVIHR
jgi:hypothetical protein